MRIVDVCAFYSSHGGGVKTYVERKLRAGAAAGHEIVVLAPGEGDRIRERVEGGARVVSLPNPRFPLDRRYGYFADERGLHAMLDRLAPDLVEVSSPWTSAAMVARWPGPAPRALVMHADPVASYAYRWLRPLASEAAIDQAFGWYWRHLRRLDARYDLVVSASRSLSERLAARGLTKVVTQPMGVEPGLFAPSRRDEGLRARLLEGCGLGPDATLLIGAGRLAPEKRWPLVIEAVTAAACRRPIGLVLLGDGRERAKVLRAIGRNPHIRLLAPIADRARFAGVLASADALVHGCESETFGMVAAEARASGLPLIVPAGGGAFDQLRDGGVGWDYPAANAAGARVVLRRLSPARLADARRRAVATAAATPTMDAHFGHLFDRYRALIAPPPVIARRA